MKMRNKEIALNFACSAILPIDENTEKQLLIVCESRPIRLNAALGKEMLADNPIEESSESEEYISGEEGEEVAPVTASESSEGFNSDDMRMSEEEEVSYEKIDFSLAMEDKISKMEEHMENIVRDQFNETRKEIKRETSGFQIDAEAMKEKY